MVLRQRADYVGMERGPFKDAWFALHLILEVECPDPGTACGFLEVYFDAVTGRNTVNIFRHERKSQSFAVRRASGANFDESELRGSANRAGTLGYLQLHLVSYRRLISWAERVVCDNGTAMAYKMVPIVVSRPPQKALGCIASAASLKKVLGSSLFD